MTMVKFQYALFLILYLLSANINAKIPCDPDSFQFLNPPEIISQYKEFTLKIGNAEEIGCAINATFHWEIFRVKGKTLIPIKENVFETKATKGRENKINLNKLPQLQTLYNERLAIRVTLIPESTHYPSYRLHFINIEPEKYAIQMEGGKEINHTLGDGDLNLKVLLEGESKRPVPVKEVKWSCSPPFLYDTSSSGLEWTIPESFLRANTYNCNVTVILDKTSLSTSQIINILPEKQLRILVITCKQNCNESQTNMSTVFAYECYGQCNDTPIWSIDPSDKEIDDKLIKGSSLTIPAFTLRSSTEYRVHVSLGGTNASRPLNFVSVESVLNITCIKNCFDRTKEMQFRVHCEENCEPDMIYHWEISTYPKNWNWSSFNYTTNNSIITVPPYGLPPRGDIILLAKTLTSRVYGLFREQKINKPELKFTCIENCPSPDPTAPVKLLAVCIKFCDDVEYINFIASPTTRGWQATLKAPAHRAYLTIPPNTYKPGQRVNVSAFVTSYETKELNIYLLFAKPPPYSIICVKNCENNVSSIHHVTILAINCSGCNYTEFKWWLSPMPEGDNYIETYNGTRYLFIPGGAYSSAGPVMAFADRNGTAENYTLNFKALLPQLEFYCLENCFNVANPNMDVKLQIVCVKNCYNIHYKWELSPKEDLAFWTYNVELSFQTRIMTIKKNSYQPKEQVVVTVTSYPFYGKAAYLLRFGNPMPVLTLNCVENCDNSWTHIAAKFLTKCWANCQNINIIWDFFPKPVGFHWDDTFELLHTNSALNIRPFRFQDQETITLSAAANGAKVFLNVTFEEIPFNISFLCKPRPCEKVQNAKEIVEVIIVCSQFCENKTFEWILNPVPKDFEWDAHIIRGIENKSITILGQTFNEGDTVNVEAWVLKSRISTVLRFARPEPEFQIFCRQNCNHSNPHEPVHLEVVCEWLCQYIDTYEWSIKDTGNVSSKEFWYRTGFSPRKNKIIIPSSVYKNGDIVNMTAYWGNRSISKTITIAFVEPKPVLIINCVRNNIYNLLQPTVFEVTCLHHCQVPYEYEWVTTPAGKEKPIFYNKMKAMVIPPNSYEENDVVNITVCKGKSCTSEVITFILPKPDLKITCSENCDKFGIANPKMPTKLEVSCLVRCEPVMIYLWQIDPKPIKNEKNSFMYQKLNQTLVILGNVYLSGSNVLVTVTSAGGFANYKISFIQPEPGFVIQCVKNCVSNPARRVKLTVVCYTNCYNESVIWMMTPWVRLFEWNKNIILSDFNKTLILKKNTFVHGESALFVATMGNTKAEKLIEFKLPYPVLKLECKPTCVDANPYEKVIIRVRCLQFCDDIKYTWSISPMLEGFIWSINVTIGDNNQTITIKEHSYNSLDIVDVTVQTNRSIGVSTTLNYKAKAPIVTINCVENCDYSLEEDIMLVITCIGNCQEFKKNVQCHLQNVLIDNVLERKDYVITVKPHSFQAGDKVNLSCSDGKVNVLYPIEFFYSPELGHCKIIPYQGIGGITRHSLNCIDFPKDTIFHITQEVIGSKYLGMKLVRSRSLFTSEFFLAPGDGVNPINVQIDVYRGNLFLKTIILKASIIPFVYNTPLISKRAHIDHYKSFIDLNDRERLELKLEELKDLVYNNDVIQALQMAFVLDKTLNFYPESTSLHFRYHILEQVYTFVHKLNPMQSYLFINSLLHSNAFNPAILHLSMEIVLAGSILLVRKKKKIIYYEERALLQYGKIALFVSELVVEKSSDCAKKIEQDLLNSDFYFDSESTDLYEFHKYADPIRHLKYMCVAFLKNLEIIIETLKFAREESDKYFIYYKLLLHFVTTSVLSTSVKKIISRMDQTFVEIVPYDYYYGYSFNLTFTLANIPDEVFWWNNHMNKVSGEIVYFSVSSNLITKMQGPFRIYIKLYTPINLIVLHQKIAGDEFQLWKINIETNFTFRILMIADGLRVYIGNVKPNKQYVLDFGNDSHEYYLENRLATKSPLYMGIVYLIKNKTLNQLISMNFIGIQCLAWHGEFWQWSVEGCSVTIDQMEYGFVTCRCDQLSLFTANVSVPTLLALPTEPDPPFPTQNNDWVFYSAVILALIFLTFIIIGCMIDRRMWKARALIFLSDNNIKNSELYLICVQTGIWKNAGTSSRVAIQVTGARAKSDVHLLNVSNGKVLRRNSADYFIMLTEKYLGDIKFIQLWHDSHGNKPEWFCETIIVRHIKSGSIYVFQIYRWFSLVRVPCNTQGKFVPFQKKKGPFSSKLARSIRANHSYLTFIENRKFIYSYAEHVAISFASTFGMMAVCFLSEIDSSLGIYDYYWLIILICAGVGSIITLLLDLLFCNSPPLIVHKRGKIYHIL